MSRRCAAGFTLVEMVMAIVILGVGLAGALTAFNTAVQSSADPLIHKQMLSVAEEMLEEILLKPFAVAGTAPANAEIACGAAASRAAFDDVSDYNGYRTTSVCDIDGDGVAGLADYAVAVNVDAAATLGALGAGEVRRVTVAVTRGAETVTLVGWRTNYAAP